MTKAKSLLSAPSHSVEKAKAVAKVKPSPPLRGTVGLPPLFSKRVKQLGEGVTVFECLKREFVTFAELAGHSPTAGQSSLALNQSVHQTPVAVFRATSGIHSTNESIEIRSAQIPDVVFGVTDELGDEDRIICVVTPSNAVPFFSKNITAAVDPVRVRFGTLYERVKLTDFWTELELMSEPFVNNESFGYCAVIQVRTRTGDNKYLQVSPRSIRDILESMRVAETGLIGVKIRIRKKSSAQESGFEGYRISAFSS